MRKYSILWYLKSCLRFPQVVSASNYLRFLIFHFIHLHFSLILSLAALQYQWYKNPDINNTVSNVFTKTMMASNFIRPDLNTYTFISYNGNLYFSEVQSYDAGMYYCVVTLSAPVGYRLSTTQPPSRTSKGIELKVGGSRK